MATLLDGIATFGWLLGAACAVTAVCASLAHALNLDDGERP